MAQCEINSNNVFCTPLLIKEWQVKLQRLYQNADAGRFYHTAAHIMKLLSLFDKYSDRIMKKDVVVYSILFHDAVYDPEAPPGQNEKSSASLFEEYALEAGEIPEDTVMLVKAYIEATIRHEIPESLKEDIDLRYFLDFDLEILATEPSVYDNYSLLVRKEYNKLNDLEWKSGRGRVLRSLLEREQIYYSELGEEKWEKRARQNLSRELKTLGL